MIKGGCHCEIHGRRRRGEGCRYRKIKPGWYAPKGGCVMGERRRAAVSDCRCNKAPSGYTCPGCWWSQGCGKNKCIRSCRKKMKKIIGFWEPLANNVGSHKFSTTYGTRVTDRVVTTTQISKWSETTTSFGVSVMGKVAGIEL